MDTQELVILTPLTEADRSIGELAANLISSDASLGVIAIFWWFDTDSKRWKFTVASSAYREKGPRFTYSKIRTILKSNDLLEKLPLDKIWAIEDKHYILGAIFSVIRPVPHVGFENCIMNGLPVAGAYFLFAAPKRAKRRAGVRRKKT